MPCERACDHPCPTLFTCSSGGGGIWRHKWLIGRYVLMAAMHSGFVAVGPVCPSQYNDYNEMLEPLAWYRPSAKLAYGIDCYDHRSGHLTDDKHLLAIVATCSFYDNSVNFSRITLPSVPSEWTLFFVLFSSASHDSLQTFPNCFGLYWTWFGWVTCSVVNSHRLMNCIFGTD